MSSISFAALSLLALSPRRRRRQRDVIASKEATRQRSEATSLPGAQTRTSAYLPVPKSAEKKPRFRAPDLHPNDYLRARILWRSTISVRAIFTGPSKRSPSTVQRAAGTERPITHLRIMDGVKISTDRGGPFRAYRPFSRHIKPAAGSSTMGKDAGMVLGHAVQPAEIDYTVDNDDALDLKNQQQNNAPVDVWENGDGTGVDFRTLSWIKAAALETKLQIGLGILSIVRSKPLLGLLSHGQTLISSHRCSTPSAWPAVCLSSRLPDSLPFVSHLLPSAFVTKRGSLTGRVPIPSWRIQEGAPGSVLLSRASLTVCAITANLLSDFNSVGMILAGPVGREVGGFLVWLFMFIIGGAAFVGASVSLNAMSIHGTCTVVFVAVCAIISAVIGSFRTLSKISWISWVGVTGILSAVITLAVAVSLQDRPSAAPQTGPWDKDLKVMGYPNFVAGLGAVSNVFFGYAGAPYYFAIVSEFRDARQYPKSILLSQGVTMGAFIVRRCP